MKVLQVLPELNAGGVERGTLEIAGFLVRNGHEALVVSHGGRLVPELEKLGARHIKLAVHRKSLLSLLQIRTVRRLLEMERPDVLHLRSRVPGWIAWLAWRKLDPRTRPHLVTTVHGFYSVNSYSAIMTRGERVIAVSESIRDYVLKNYRSTPRESVRVIPRGIDRVRYPRGYQPSAEWLAKWRSDFPGLAHRLLLTLPGRVTRLKGHEDFIALIGRMAATKPLVHGLIVGGVDPKKKNYFAELQTRVARSGLADRITFTGHRDDVREILAVSDVVFSLSTKPESFGRTTLEAISLGRPVVAYDHGGVAEQLRRLYPVGLVPLRHEAELHETVDKVLAGVTPPALVAEPYTVFAMCDATIRTYRELLDGKPFAADA